MTARSKGSRHRRAGSSSAIFRRSRLQRTDDPVAPESRKRRKAPVRIFRMTVSSFHYDERRHQAVEYEMYFNINRRARTGADVKRILTVLEEKGRRHFRYWLLKHLNVHLERRVQINFEKEQRAKRQAEQPRASVQRLLMRRVDKRWEAQELSQGTMRFVKRPRKHVRA